MVKIGMLINDRYEIVEKIGTGGMSDVYKSKDHKLNRYVAVKVLKQEFSENTNFVGKFRIEAQAAGGLSHPNIVNVYDVGEENGIYYIVMELVEGITLKRYIEKKARLSVREATSIAIQISMGIESAHSNHIIHRDIKPQNIIISKDGKVKITDFGIAKAATSNTITSNVMGSVHYTSPEQARGGFSDEKSDVYSLGITLFEMLTGRVPFNGDTTVAIAIKHIQEDMPSPREYVPEIPLSIEQIVLKCTMKSPDRRYQNMTELTDDLKHSLRNPDEAFVKMDEFDRAGETKAINSPDLEAIRKKRTQMMAEEAAYGQESYQEEEISPVPTRPKRTETKTSVIPKETERPVKKTASEKTLEGKNKNNKNSQKSNASSSDKIMTGITIGLAVVIGIVVLILVGKTIGIFGGTGNEEYATETVTLPKMVGRDYQEVETELTSQGLKVNKSFEDSSTVPENLVISADKEEGESVKKNSTITLKISAGVDGVKVPSVLGVSLAEASSTLKKQGFKVTTVEAYSTEVSKNNIISQSPEADTKVARGTEITLTVSLGEEEVFDKMPNVVGMTVDQARSTLVEHGYSVNSVVSTYSNEYPDGVICHQSYLPDTDVKKGTGVDLQQSIGPDPTIGAVNAGGGSYQYVGEIKAPTSADYVYGSEVVVSVVTADGVQLWKTSSMTFPLAVNIRGISSAYGTVYLQYTVSAASVTTTDPETGAQVTTPGGTETRTEERTVYFTEE